MPLDQHRPTVELIRASMEPASGTALLRSESPACQVVSTAARADLDAEGTDNLTRLALGAGVSAATLTDVLSSECGKQSEDILRALAATTKEDINPDVPRLLQHLMGDDGMKAVAVFLGEMFTTDQERFLDLIVSLGEYAAGCVELLSSARASTVEETLAEVEEMLREFHAS